MDFFFQSIFILCLEVQKSTTSIFWTSSHYIKRLRRKNPSFLRCIHDSIFSWPANGLQCLKVLFGPVPGLPAKFGAHWSINSRGVSGQTIKRPGYYLDECPFDALSQVDPCTWTSDWQSPGQVPSSTDHLVKCHPRFWCLRLSKKMKIKIVVQCSYEPVCQFSKS